MYKFLKLINLNLEYFFFQISKLKLIYEFFKKIGQRSSRAQRRRLVSASAGDAPAARLAGDRPATGSRDHGRGVAGPFRQRPGTGVRRALPDRVLEGTRGQMGPLQGRQRRGGKSTPSTDRNIPLTYGTNDPLGTCSTLKSICIPKMFLFDFLSPFALLCLKG